MTSGRTENRDTGPDVSIDASDDVSLLEEPRSTATPTHATSGSRRTPRRLSSATIRIIATVALGAAAVAFAVRFGVVVTAIVAAIACAIAVPVGRSTRSASRPRSFGQAKHLISAVAIGDVGETDFDGVTAGLAGVDVVDRIAVDTCGTDVHAPIQAAEVAASRVLDGTAECVVIVASSPGYPAVNAMIRRLSTHGIEAEILTGAAGVSPSRAGVGQLGQFTTLRIKPRKQGRAAKATKRTLDITASALGLLVTLPLFLLTALAIRLDSPGPVFYRQSRLGRSGRQFEIWKFRSMVADAEERLIDLTNDNAADGPLFKMRHDPRVTRVGRVLRRWSLDELPQLINVLRGHMSLVGPRPALPSEADGWSPELFDRLGVRPGLTGPWQVSGRSDSSFDEYSRLDLYYVDNWSLRLDLEIIARTVPAIISGDGAY